MIVSLFWMYLGLVVALAATFFLWLLALPVTAKMEARIGTIRLAIWAALIGASVWVFAPLMVASLFGDDRTYVALGLLRLSIREVANGMGWGVLVAQSVQNEIAVVTIAGVAWVLAGLVKLKA